MRERNPQDWVRDLSGRHGLEAQVADALHANQSVRLLENNTHRFDQLDFTVATRHVPRATVELKAKWQPYRGWDHHRPDIAETELFIIDELAIRRIVASGPTSQLLVFDAPGRRWVIYSVIDLVLAPKARVARPINNRHKTVKGKILLSMTDAMTVGPRIEAAIDAVTKSINNTHKQWSQVEPWPHPHKKAI